LGSKAVRGGFAPGGGRSGTGQWLARCWQRAVPDFPDVFQSLIGYAATGQALIEASVDKVAFTGSVRSGRAVAAQCAATLTPMLLELGGKDPVIVAEDADLDEAAAHITSGALAPTREIPPRAG
jgi:aldehyde dehydrogenase (NAD+)